MLVRSPAGYAPTSPEYLFAAYAEKLHSTVGQFPAARRWNMAGINSGAFTTTPVEVSPGSAAVAAFPSAAGTLTVTRNAADNGVTCNVIVEYLDADFYHRSAVFPFTAGGSNTASTDITGASITAWRALDAVWMHTATNIGPASVAIGGVTQVRIGATHGMSQGSRFTVPRGQTLMVSGYRASVDATKTATFAVRGASINTSNGQRLEILVESTTEVTEAIGEQFVPRIVAGTNLAGVYQTSAVDLWTVVTFASNTTTQIDCSFQGILALDEDDMDPHPERIPWVASRLARLASLA